MGSGVLLGCVLAAAALVIAPPPRLVRSGQRSSRPGLSPRPRALLGALVLASAVLLLGLPWWCSVMAGAAAGLVAMRSAGRQRPPTVQQRRGLAAVLDAFAVCLDAGLPTATALSATLPMPQTGATANRELDALARTAALLGLGAAPDTAWQPVAASPLLSDLATAACRSATGGLRLAEAVRETCADIRQGCHAEVKAGAARAGVLITAPLTLCYLPAFLCLGLAPTVIGLISSLGLW